MRILPFLATVLLPSFVRAVSEPVPPTVTVVCTDLTRKRQCKQAAKKHGCYYLRETKECMHKDDIPCEALTKVNLCKRNGTCKWKNKKCESKCRKPNPNTACPEMWDPVKCGDCEYGNICFAKAAGQKTKICKKVCTTEKDCGNRQVCYKEENKEEGVCIKPTRKRCGGIGSLKCPIGQKCVRNPWDKKCTQVNGSDCMGVCIAHGCNKPRPSKCSDDQHSPIMCGECSYASPCLAKSAGVNPEKCRPFCTGACKKISCPADAKPHTKPGDCCPSSCEPLEKCVKADCMKCPVGTEPVTKPGECCPTDCIARDKCGGISCDMPICPDGATPVTKEGDCCPSCPPNDSCKPGVSCPIRQCWGGAPPTTKKGDCCPSCPPMDECYNILCAMPQCLDGATPVTKEGDCCPSCPLMDKCKLVSCPMPKCMPGTRQVTKEGECCPTCEPYDECKLVDCEEPQCPADSIPIKKDGECCASTCVKVCNKKACQQIRDCPKGQKLHFDGCCNVCQAMDEKCDNVACLCKEGYKQVFDDKGCCAGCQKEDTCHEECEEIKNCPGGHDMVFDGCCLVCKKPSTVCPLRACKQCKAGYQPTYDDNGCCDNGCEAVDNCGKRLCKEIKQCPKGYEMVNDGCCMSCKKIMEEPCERCDCRDGYEEILNSKGCCTGCGKKEPCADCQCKEGYEPTYDDNKCCTGCKPVKDSCSNVACPAIADCPGEQMVKGSLCCWTCVMPVQIVPGPEAVPDELMNTP